MLTIKDRAAKLAKETRDAYSAGQYYSWESVCAMLLRRGYSEVEAEVILRSKYTRWARDASPKMSGPYSANDLKRYLDKMGRSEKKQVASLVLEVYPNGIPVKCPHCGK